MVIFAVGAIVRYGFDLFIQFFVVRYDRAAVAHTAEVLSQIERKSPCVRQVADTFALIQSSMRLRTVLKHFQTVFLGNFPNFLHLNGLTVQVNDHNRLCPRRDRRFNFIGVDVVSVDVRFNQNRCAAVFGNRQYRRNIGVRRNDDFIARAIAVRPNDQVQRVQPVRNADSKLCAAKLSKMFAKQFVLFALQIIPLVQNTGKTGINSQTETIVYFCQIKKRYHERLQNKANGKILKNTLLMFSPAFRSATLDITGASRS